MQKYKFGIKKRREKKYSPGHGVSLVRSGPEYFEMLEKVVSEARYYIHFQTYILEEDSTGYQVAALLKAASCRGVKVYLIVDAFGSSNLTSKSIEDLVSARVHFRRFAPVFTYKGFQLSRRLHHKVVLVDGHTALIGGINNSDNYRGRPGRLPWLDFAVLLRGPECKRVLHICQAIWNRPLLKKTRGRIHNPYVEHPGKLVKVVENNWFRSKIEISKSYRDAFRQSREEIIIMASYFVPGLTDRRLLRKAASRGVKVRVIFSKHSDARMVKRASRYLYGYLLRNGMEIHEYKPSMVHGKVCVVDGEWVTVGSYNMNHLSDYGSIELNVNVLDREFTGQARAILLDVIAAQCEGITIENYIKLRDWKTKLLDWISYHLIRFSMRMMFLLTRKEEM
jgi:cardiolipin synthase A/B